MPDRNAWSDARPGRSIIRIVRRKCRCRRMLRRSPPDRRWTYLRICLGGSSQSALIRLPLSALCRQQYFISTLDLISIDRIDSPAIGLPGHARAKKRWVCLHSRRRRVSISQAHHALLRRLHGRMETFEDFPLVSPCGTNPKASRLLRLILVQNFLNS